MTEKIETSKDAPTLAYLEREIERLNRKVHDIQDAVKFMLRILQFPCQLHAPLSNSDHSFVVDRYFKNMTGRSIDAPNNYFKELFND